MEREFPVIVYNRMPCIRPSLKTDDNICIFCKHIRNLSFSFIAPVGPYYCFYHNKILLFQFRKCPLSTLFSRRELPVCFAAMKFSGVLPWHLLFSSSASAPSVPFFSRRELPVCFAAMKFSEILSLGYFLGTCCFPVPHICEIFYQMIIHNILL